jgi:hypothetical protein
LPEHSGQSPLPVYNKLPRFLFTSFPRGTSLLFSVAALLIGGAAAVRGQSALDGFDPNANGAIYAVVVQRDGKILAGGEFNGANGIGGPDAQLHRPARCHHRSSRFVRAEREQ